MADKTGIEWTDATHRAAATRIGMSVTDYAQRRTSGEKWCIGCRAWHLESSFGRDSSRGDGLTARCLESQRIYNRTRYSPKGRPATSGPAPHPPRDGDRRQARKRVNQLVLSGKLPRPSDLPCVDCGHMGGTGRERHEYDHHRGYAAEHHLSVEAVCIPCHNARELARKDVA